MTRAQVLSRRRETVDVHPLDVSNCATWLDASQITGKVDGDTVTSWTDLSGNSRPATTADATTGAVGPTYKTAIRNGLPVLRFSAHLLAQAALGSPIAQPFTILLVVQCTAGRITDGPKTGTNRTLTDRSGAQAFSFQAGGAGVTSGATGTNDIWSVVASQANGVSSFMRANGNQGTTGNAGTNPVSGLSLGGNYFLSSSMAGDLAEVLVYASALSAADIGRLERYLARKWGIAVA